MSNTPITAASTPVPAAPSLVSKKIGANDDPYLTNLQAGQQYILDNAGFVGAATALEKTSHLGREVYRGLARIPIFYVGVFSYLIAWITALFIGQFIAAAVIINMLGFKQPLPKNADTLALFFIGGFLGCVFGRILHKRLRICNSEVSDKGHGSVCASFEDCSEYTPDAWSLRLVDKFRRENTAKNVTNVISASQDSAHAGLTEHQRKIMLRGPCHPIEFSWFVFFVRLCTPIICLGAGIGMFTKHTKSGNPDSSGLERYYAMTMGVSVGWCVFAVFS
jgi:hypothetical protein